MRQFLPELQYCFSSPKKRTPAFPSGHIRLNHAYASSGLMVGNPTCFWPNTSATRKKIKTSAGAIQD